MLSQKPKAQYVYVHVCVCVNQVQKLVELKIKLGQKPKTIPQL